MGECETCNTKACEIRFANLEESTKRLEARLDREITKIDEALKEVYQRLNNVELQNATIIESLKKNEKLLLSQMEWMQGIISQDQQAEEDEKAKKGDFRRKILDGTFGWILAGGLVFWEVLREFLMKKG